MRFAGNLLTSASMKILNALLKFGKILSSLDLSDNYLSDYGWHILLNNLVRNDILSILKLNNVGLGDESARDVSTILRTNTTLKSLSIDNNDITLVGLKRIVESLKENKVLNHISLVGKLIIFINTK